MFTLDFKQLFYTFSGLEESSVIIPLDAFPTHLMYVSTIAFTQIFLILVSWSLLTVLKNIVMTALSIFFIQGLQNSLNLSTSLFILFIMIHISFRYTFLKFLS